MVAQVGDGLEVPARSRVRIRRWSATLLPAVLLAVLAWDARWTADDGFIHLRVVDQLLHGNGPVFNAGERVEASSSVLWVAILALARLATFATVRLEHLAMWLAIAGSVLGLGAAGAAARRLAERTAGANEVLVPFGSLVVVALQPFWHFSTSGLESGLLFGWLGAAFWTLVTLASRSDPPRPSVLGGAVLLGAGPLIRPDAAVYSAAFVGALLLATPRRGSRRTFAVIVAALALPAAYQVFRMGYYGALVPNPAIAKSAGGSSWGRGLRYLLDFVAPYHLWIPLALVGGAVVRSVRRLGSATGARALRLVVLAPVAGALLHALYITRVGGDFMHARLLLPALFALVMPVAVISLDRTRLVRGAAVTIALWASVSCTLLRRESDVASGITNERGQYVVGTGRRHPLTVEDHRGAAWFAGLDRMDAKRASGRRVLITDPLVWWYGYVDDRTRVLPLSLRVHAEGAVSAVRIGAVAYAAGPDVFVVDRMGLADPVAARFVGQPLVIAGHDKLLTLPWIEARVAAPVPRERDPLVARDAADARAALACGELLELVRAVQQPLTLTRFVDNVRGSVRRTTLVVPWEPARARERFCAG